MVDAATAPIADSAPAANTTRLSSTTANGNMKKATIVTRAYQQEMLETSLASNIIIALEDQA
jgi:hypothetical protein